MLKPSKYEHHNSAALDTTLVEGRMQHYRSFLSKLEKTATPDEVLSKHKLYLQTQDLSKKEELELLKSLQSFEEESNMATENVIMEFIFAFSFMSVGIILLLLTPGTQPVAVGIAALMLAAGAAAAIHLVMTYSSFKHWKRPLNEKHMDAISSLIQERDETLTHHATLPKPIGSTSTVELSAPNKEALVTPEKTSEDDSQLNPSTDVASHGQSSPTTRKAKK